ncbi:MAG: HNH endonuclease [Treponema sp.]|nr:HNH endonuclease [Treponema sp.]
MDDKRLFTIDDKRELLSQKENKDGKYKCEICNKWFFPEELQVDHIEAWSKGGRTVLSNAQLLCAPCNRKKSNL